MVHEYVSILFSSVVECKIRLDSWMDGGPVYGTRNQGTHLGGAGLCVLRLNHPTRKIPTQEYHLALSPIRVTPKEPQTLGAAVRNKGFGFVTMIRPLRGVVVRFPTFSV